MKHFLRFTLLLAFLFIHEITHAQLPSAPSSIMLPDTAKLTWKGKVKKKARHGEWKATDAAGKTLVIATYNRGVPEGRWEMYYPSGVLYERGTYAQGKRTGLWVGFNPGGDSLYSASLENGVLHGPFRGYTARGRIQTIGHYEHGRKEGRWEYHPMSLSRSRCIVDHYMHDTLHGLHQDFINGKLVEEMTMQKGKRHGASVVYWENGQIKRRTWFANDSTEGPFVSYNMNGDTLEYGSFSGNLKTGYWEYRTEGKVMKREWFGEPLMRPLHNGYYKKNGPPVKVMARPDSVYQYYSNGRLKLKEIYRDTTDAVRLQGGIKDVTEYHEETGAVKSTYTVNRFYKIGTIYTYDTNGRLISVVWTNSVSWNGPATWYHNNGVVRAKDTLHYNTLSKNLKLYDRKGKVIPVTSPLYNQMRDSLYTFTPGLMKPYEEVVMGERTQDGRPDEEVDMIMPVENTVEEIVDPDPVFQFADEMPSFPGGDTAYKAYMYKNLQYPGAEKEAGVQGNVWVQFEIAKDGSVQNVISVHSIAGHPAMEREAIRVIRAMPKWNPGKMNGKPVRVRMTLPVRFVLK